MDKCRMANPVKRATVRPCSEKGTTGPVKRLTNQPTYDLVAPPHLLPLPGGGEPGAPGLIGGSKMLRSAGEIPAAGAIPA